MNAPAAPPVPFFARRGWRVFLGVTLGGAGLLAGAVAVYYAVENAAGRRAWREVRELAAARGEPLTLADATPGPVRPADDFGAAPVFAGVLAAEADIAARGARWRMPVADSELPEPGFGVWWRGDPVPLDQWRAYLATDDLGGFLDRHAPDMAAVALASRRPHARFAVDYSQSVFSGMPYLPALRSLSRLFALRAVARLEKGDRAAALADVCTVFRLVAVPREEPFLLTHLAANANANFGLQAVREGLARGAWSDEDLRVLSAELARLDLLGSGMHGLRGELAFGAEYMEQLALDSRAAVSRATRGGYETEFIHYVPSGWVYRNMALMGRLYLDDIFPSWDAENRRVDLQRLLEVDRRVAQMPPQPSTILTRMFMPALYKAIVNCAATQTQVELARVACALELCRRARGAYPESLDALAAALPAGVGEPWGGEIGGIHDLVTGEPPRYRRLAGGGFTLYATGANRTDDGGVVAINEDGSLNPMKGDWVWPGPARSRTAGPAPRVVMQDARSGGAAASSPPDGATVPRD
ncbi:hypothetical protein OpiT1DRAFT_02124 [Opitutaceae bacterium TAV1]|nr:hypothetical protein OpiT1DRAFT_02124 [Opitutaceae bacterium TAV1]